MDFFKKIALSTFFVILFWAKTFAQDEPSLLDMLGEDETTNHATNAFKSPRAINGHSMEMLLPGTMDFRILHRFGAVNDGYYQLFGLDQASMRMGFDFGLTPNLMAGFGRSTNKKELDFFGKYRLLWQSTGKRRMPISLVWVSGLTINGLKDPAGNPEVPVTFDRRLGYYHELIVGRKFSEKLTLQIAPMLVHQNIVPRIIEPNTMVAASFAGRYKFTKRMAVVWDYAHVFNRAPGNIWADPLSLGIDIETGGHVFQLHFSNAVGMNERAFVRDENASWTDGAIRFGFNLSRVFQIVKHRPD